MKHRVKVYDQRDRFIMTIGPASRDRAKCTSLAAEVNVLLCRLQAHWCARVDEEEGEE